MNTQPALSARIAQPSLLSAGGAGSALTREPESIRDTAEAPVALRPVDRSRAGFTLMEVAIAVAVVVVGLLAMFALIASGLDASARSVADTQAALFADAVFGSLQAESQAAAQKGVRYAGNNVTIEGVYWREFWKDFNTGGKANGIPIASYPAFQSDGAQPYYMIYRDTDGRSGQLKGPSLYKPINIPQHTPNVQDIVSEAMRYTIELDVTEQGGFNAANFEKNADNTTIKVTLRIWNGEFGPNPPPLSEALTFYAEFDNPGDL